MKDVYQKLVTLTVRSEYFGEGTETYAHVHPTWEWIDFFEKHQIKFRTVSNGIFLSCTAGGRERLRKVANEQPYLTFELISTYPGIKNVVDVPQYTNRSTPYLISAAGTTGFNDQFLLPVRRSLSTLYVYPTAIITKDIPGSDEPLDVLHDTTLRPGEREFPLLLAAIPDGKYSVRGTDFYLAKNGLRPGHCAIVAINLKEALQEEIIRKELDVPTREIYLKYWVNSDHHDLNTLAVKDNDGNITFESKGIGQYGMLFQSSTTLKLLKQSPYQIQLVNGKKKPLIDKLPLGNAMEMKPMEQQPDEYFNEVFINV